VNAFDGVVINGVAPGYVGAITTLNGYSILINDDIVLPVNNTATLSPANVGITSTNSSTSANAFVDASPGGITMFNTPNGTDQATLEVNSTTFNYFKSGAEPAFYQFKYGTINNVWRYDNTGIQMGATGTGVNINLNNIKYPTSYNTASVDLTTTSNAVQTFNGATLTAKLPDATATNVGTQFTITNTNASNLTVSTVGGTQLIYSSTGAPSSVSRVLAQGHSHIFTAILTTGASTFGWSMV
jgi:hypothetical protein